MAHLEGEEWSREWVGGTHRHVLPAWPDPDTPLDQWSRPAGEEVPRLPLRCHRSGALGSQQGCPMTRAAGPTPPVSQLAWPHAMPAQGDRAPLGLDVASAWPCPSRPEALTQHRPSPCRGENRDLEQNAEGEATHSLLDSEPLVPKSTRVQERSGPSTPAGSPSSRLRGRPVATPVPELPPRQGCKDAWRQQPCSNLTLKLIWAARLGGSAGKGGEAQAPPSDPRHPMTLPSPPRSLCAAGGPSQEDDQGLHVCRKGPHPALPWQWGPALAVRMQLLIGGPHAPQHVAQVLGHHPRQVKHHHGRLQERQA